MKKVISLIFIMLIFNNVYAKEKKQIDSLNTIEKKSKISFNMFIPGVYQLNQGKIVKGCLIFGSEIFFVTAAIFLVQASNKAYSEYMDIDNDGIRDDKENPPVLNKEMTLKDFNDKINYANNTLLLSQITFGIAGSIYIFSLIDNILYIKIKPISKKNISFNFDFKNIRLCYKNKF